MLRSHANLGRLKAFSNQRFSIFYYVSMSTKSKTGSQFPRCPSVKFRKIWQIGNIYFTLVGIRL